MTATPLTAARPARGFSLIELMVTLVIGAILLSIAVPSYQSSIRKGRRTEAKSALLDFAGREERLYSTTNAYSLTATDLGYASFPATVGSGYYTLSVTGSATAYTVTATAVGTQAKDTTCPTFTIDNTGVQGPTTTAATCWN